MIQKNIFLSYIRKPNLYKYIMLLITGSMISFMQTATAQTSWWNDAVFYEVFVRSFKDHNGDGKGDLKGLIQKLDYLNDGNPDTHNDLGVTGIWLMPVQQSPSYHGYDVTNYRAVEQDYGTNADFKEFIDSAHARGIKVIIDLVMNHTSSQHPWFVESTNPMSAKRNWYTWQPTNPGNTGPWGQTVWHPRSGNYNYGIFWSEMPDLNYNTTAVKDTMFEVARFWLEDMNVDGFRLDAIKYIYEDGTTLEDTPETITFWKEFRTHYKSINSDAVGVGEAWTSTDKVAPYVGTDGLDYCFEFDLAEAILNTANTGSVTGLKDQMDEVTATYPALQFGTFLTNHDINRVMNRLGYSTAKAKVAADLLLTLPGVPYIYYGEEIGMTGAKPDENIRTPLQWTNTTQGGFTTGTPWRPVNGDYTTKNIESQQLDITSLWHKYRNLIAIRNNQAALRRGSYKNVTSTSASAFAFLRQYGNENILVVSNPGAVALSSIQLSYAQGGITPGSYTFTELQNGEQINVTIDANGFSNLPVSSIPARSTLIYKLLDPSQTSSSVVFRVDMNAMINSGDFIPATESVDMVANFNSFGVDSITTLTDIDADGIYTITLSGMNIGNSIDYKYRINATNDGREEVLLRGHIVLEGNHTVNDTYRKQTVTGIMNPLRDALAIYPVPANNELYVEYTDKLSGSIHYQLSDLLGKEKMNASFDAIAQGGLFSLPCEELKEGIYTLTLSTNGYSQVFRIVVGR